VLALGVLLAGWLLAEAVDDALTSESLKSIKNAVQQVDNDDFSSGAAEVVIVCTYVMFFWIALASSVRRLHDRDRSGLWLLLNAIPIVGSLVLIIPLGFLPGFNEPNQYGPSSNSKALQVQQEVAKIDAVLRDVMAREPTFGPNARPWRERRTAKPYPEYRSARWDNWHFIGPEGEKSLILPEECVGAVFPGDWIIVNDRWRQIVEISTQYSDPVAFISPHSEPIV
jgi:uncharacterized membrane protein YhaH (DUF805 family)